MQGSSATVSSAAPLLSSCSFKDPFAQISQDPWQPLDLSENGTEASPLPEILPESSELSFDNEDSTYISSADPNASEFLLSCLIFQEQASLQASLQKTLSSVLHEDAVVTVQIDGSQQGTATAVSCTAAAAKVPRSTGAAADVDAQNAQLLQPVGSTDPNASDFLLSCLAFEQQTSLKKTLSSVLHDDAVVTVQVNASQHRGAKAVSCKAAAAAAGIQAPTGDCAADLDVEIVQLLQPVGSADPNASDFLLSCLAFEQQTSVKKTLSSVLHDDAVVTVQANASQHRGAKAVSCKAAAAAAGIQAPTGDCAADLDVEIAQLLQPVGSADPNASDFLLSCLAFEQKTSLQKALSSVLHGDAIVTVQVNGGQQTAVNSSARCSAAHADKVQLSGLTSVGTDQDQLAC